MRQEGSPQLPLYAQIKRDIRRQIEEGLLRPGDRIPSEQDLARALGVSRGPTRQALLELTSEGYLYRQTGSGTFVSPAERWGAPAAKEARLRQVAFAYPHVPISNDSCHVRHILAGFQERIQQEGHHVLFYHLAFNRESEVDFLRQVHTSGVRGLALWPQFNSRAEWAAVAHLVQARFPLVMVDQHLDGLDTDFAGTANRRAYGALTRHLLEQGHHRIGYISRDLFDQVMRHRYRGYRTALEIAGMEPDPFLLADMSTALDCPSPAWREVMGQGPTAQIPEPELRPALDAILARLLDGEHAPTAVVCSCTWTSMLVTRHIREGGGSVPGDLAVVCIDDYLEQGRRTDAIGLDGTPWRAMVQNARAIGSAAADLLLRRIAEPDRPVEHRYIEALWDSSQQEGHRQGGMAHTQRGGKYDEGLS